MGVGVRDYRLFRLDESNHVIHRADFEAENDTAAVAYAREHHPNSACELWELGRKVAVISVRGKLTFMDAPVEHSR
jgi:hypothetical protein